MNAIDAILYINLDVCQDRRHKLLTELKNLDIPPHKIHRIPAFHDPINGTRGCARSHLAALDLACAMPWKHILILEDDCTFSTDKAGLTTYIDTFLSLDLPWDVLLLGGNVFKHTPTTHPNYARVLQSHNAHAYLINHTYLPTLRALFHTAHLSMQDDLTWAHSYLKSIDRAWHPLQAQDHWYIGTHFVAQQRYGYSHIETRFIHKCHISLQ